MTKSWFEDHGIWVEDWPPHSPDLNPIEPVWKWLKIILFRLHPELIDIGKNESDWQYFKRCLVDAWEAIPLDLGKDRKGPDQTADRTALCRAQS